MVLETTLLYTPQPSSMLTLISVIQVLVLCFIGYLESKGKHLQYSKFWGSANLQPYDSGLRVSSRVGMLIFYTPSLLVGLYGFFLVPGQALRFYLVAASLVIHFLKRDFEVLFIHKFSGNISVDHAVVIATSYSVMTASMIYAQYPSHQLPEPLIDLKYVGIVVFMIGMCGNFYHHFILANLRKEGETQYKVPRGGLFSLVICPHYLFELTGFLGICFISQTIYPFLFLFGMSAYLLGRSYATKKWYLSKFDHFPKNVKCLIPYIL